MKPNLLSECTLAISMLYKPPKCTLAKPKTSIQASFLASINVQLVYTFFH